ncbi:MAG: C40 family peptidase [Pseudomonadota bacterium]|nr:C40 family peptidase [Pseudomonadota bacterium]MDO7710750.1 C40 family peptidase [Pseudomonadota bacterium]
MLNYRNIQIVKTIVLSCLGLFLVTACSTVPNNPTVTITIASPHVNNTTETLGDVIVQSAKLQMGIPYKFGGNSPSEGFDCSGLALYSHRINGISIPRQTAEQFKLGKHINRNQLNSGDLLFFRTMGQSVSHVGIYMENDIFIHAPNSRKNVETETLDNSYYKKRYLGARRYW